MHSDKKDDFKKKKIKTTCTNFFFVELLTQKQIHLVLQYVVFFQEFTRSHDGIVWCGP